MRIYRRRLPKTSLQEALTCVEIQQADWRQTETRRKPSNQFVEQRCKDKAASFLWQLLQAHHEDIAHLIGSTRQRVTTLLNELASEGLLIYTRQEICYPGVKKLQKRITVI